MGAHAPSAATVGQQPQQSQPGMEEDICAAYAALAAETWASMATALIRASAAVKPGSARWAAHTLRRLRRAAGPLSSIAAAATPRPRQHQPDAGAACVA